jgi:hypothetical protein
MDNDVIGSGLLRGFPHSQFARCERLSPGLLYGSA